MRIALAMLLGLSLLASACGGNAPGKSTSSTSKPLEFARCMRSHGVPDFPDPDAHGDFPTFRTGVSKQTSVAANDACKHLLSSGGTGTAHDRQEKLAFGVKVAQCLRAHGYPDFPDPSRLGSQSLPPGVDARSPRFQSAETACEARARKALGLP